MPGFRVMIFCIRAAGRTISPWDNNSHPGMTEDSDSEYEERIAYFISRLQGESPADRWKAIESLARMGDHRAVEPIIEALSDEDWRVRQKAAWALGFMGDDRALVPLRRALRNETEGVREMILEALDQIKMKMARG